MTERDDKPMRDVDERLADHVDGRLSARERERFDAELRVNPQLRQDLVDYERTVASLRQALTAPMHKVSLADRVVAAVVAEEAALAQPAARRGGFRFGWWSLASAAALLALALMIDRWSATPKAELTAKQDAAAAPAAPDARDVLRLRRATGADSAAAGRDGAAEQSHAPAGRSPDASQPDASASGAGQPEVGQLPLTEPPAGDPAGTEKARGGLLGSSGRSVDTPQASAPAPAPEAPAIGQGRAAPPAGAVKLQADGAPPTVVTAALPGAANEIGRSVTAEAPDAAVGSPQPMPSPADGDARPSPGAANALTATPPPGSPSTAGPAGPVRRAPGSGEPGQATPGAPSAANKAAEGKAERAEPLDDEAMPVAGGAATVPVVPVAPRLAAPTQLVTMLVIEGPVGPVPTADLSKDVGEPTHLGALRGSKDKAPAPTQQAQLIDRIDRFLGAAVAAEGRPTAKLVLTTPSGQLVLSPLVSPLPAIAAMERDSAKPEGPSGAGPAVIAETQWLVEGGKADLDVLLARVGLFTQVTQRTRQLGEVELPAPPSGPAASGPAAPGPAAPGRAPAGQAPAASDQRRLVLRFRLLTR